MIAFLLAVNVSLGYLLMSQAKKSIITLMQTRMLDISNTAAAMIDGDALERVTPADEGTQDYESIMRTLTYFQDNIDLKYIYFLMHELHRLSAAHISTGEAVVSGGLADYRPGEDQNMREVFERADAMMYKEKMQLKSLLSASGQL